MKKETAPPKRCYAVWKTGAVLESASATFHEKLTKHEAARGRAWFKNC